MLGIIRSFKSLFQRFGTETTWVVIGFVCSSLALLGGTRILTSYLSKVEYGKLALTMSLVNIFSIVFATPLSGGVVRFYNVAVENNELSVLWGLMKQWLRWSMLGIALVAILAKSWEGVGWKLAAPSAFFALFQMLNQTATGIEEAARRRRVVAGFRMFFEVGRFGMAVLFVSLVANTCEGAFMGFGIGAFIVIVLHIVYLRSRILTRGMLVPIEKALTENSIVRKKFMPYVGPLIITSICAWLYLMFDRWCLRWFCGINDVGVYTAGYQLSFVPATLGGSLLITLISPIMFQHIGDGSQTEKKNQAFKANFLIALVVLFIVLVGFLVLLIGHGFFARVFLGESFRTGSWILPWLFLSGGFFAVAQQLLLRISCEMKTYKLALLSCVMVFVAGAGYISGAAVYGWQGVVFGSVIINMTFLILSFLMDYFEGKNNESI